MADITMSTRIAVECRLVAVWWGSRGPSRDHSRALGEETEKQKQLLIHYPDTQWQPGWANANSVSGIAVIGAEGALLAAKSEGE